MGIRAVFGAAILAVLFQTPAFATVRIANDPGGQIGPYLEKLATLRSSGESVVIDGPCLSACTMLLGVIPRDRICVTARAQLGFHAAWNPKRAREVAQMRSRGMTPSSSVQAERQLPSTTTRSPEERSVA